MQPRLLQELALTLAGPIYHMNFFLLLKPPASASLEPSTYPASTLGKKPKMGIYFEKYTFNEHQTINSKNFVSK
ncbi:hypothetical protein XENTR_v10012583 [Xenopus tropicalis]|nr:hypothetical protein XENTR_v10012583 [Xenopus tropicalis]